MVYVTRIVATAVLFCTWSGTRAQNADCDSYGFGEEQQQEWSECWPTCDGDHQSPIDIDTDQVITEDLPYAGGTFYEDRSMPFYFDITNENYTVTVKLLDSDYLYLEGGPLEGRYYLEHVQFCWGSNDSVGSDHRINGQSFPMEAQWGLYNSKYDNYSYASEQPGGVLRISQLYPIQEDDNPSFAPIVNALSEVIDPWQSITSNETLTYDNIFSGYPVDDYFHYNGSFTTPPCSETVIWFVYPPLNGISKTQAAAFRQLDSTFGHLENNFRLPQPLNGRRVVRSNKSSTCLGDCETSTKASRHHRGGQRVGKKARRLGASKRRGAARQHGAASRHGAARRHHH